jgi:hypothetical protein
MQVRDQLERLAGQHPVHQVGLGQVTRVDGDPDSCRQIHEGLFPYGGISGFLVLG